MGDDKLSLPSPPVELNRFPISLVRSELVLDAPSTCVSAPLGPGKSARPSGPLGADILRQESVSCSLGRHDPDPFRDKLSCMGESVPVRTPPSWHTTEISSVPSSVFSTSMVVVTSFLRHGVYLTAWPVSDTWRRFNTLAMLDRRRRLAYTYTSQ